MIRKYQSKDLQAIVDILNYYAKNDACIFQMEPYTFEEITKKFETIVLTYPIFVEEQKGKVVFDRRSLF